MPSTVKILRSTTPGATPASLSSGQIAINEADGVLFYRNASGAVSQFTSGSGGGSSLVVRSSAASFPGTGSATVVYLDSTRSRLYRWVAADSVYAEIGTIGGLADAMDGGVYA